MAVPAAPDVPAVGVVPAPVPVELVPAPTVAVPDAEVPVPVAPVPTVAVPVAVVPVPVVLVPDVAVPVAVVPVVPDDVETVGVVLMPAPVPTVAPAVGEPVSVDPQATSKGTATISEHKKRFERTTSLLCYYGWAKPTHV